MSDMFSVFYTQLSAPLSISVCVSFILCFQTSTALGVKMRGLFLVEPVVALYAFSCYLIFPLVQQYVYRRLWEELTNTTYPVSDNAARCAQNSSNHSSFHTVRH